MSKPKIFEYTIGDLKITIDYSQCLSCGSCAVVAPKTFELDKNFMPKVKEKGPYDDEKVIKEAVESCAVGAIKIKKNPE